MDGGHAHRARGRCERAPRESRRPQPIRRSATGRSGESGGRARGGKRRRRGGGSVGAAAGRRQTRATRWRRVSLQDRSSDRFNGLSPWTHDLALTSRLTPLSCVRPFLLPSHRCLILSLSRSSDVRLDKCSRRCTVPRPCLRGRRPEAARGQEGLVLALDGFCGWL